MSGNKKSMQKIQEKLDQVVEKNKELELALAKKTEDMELEMTRLQDELMELKKSKLDGEIDLKLRFINMMSEVKTLTATVNRKKSPPPNGATDLTTRLELASIRKDIKDVQDDIEDMKTDVGRISASVQQIPNGETDTSTHNTLQHLLVKQSVSSATPSSTPGRKKRPSSTVTSPQQLKKFREDVYFNVARPSIPGGLQTGQYVVVRGYSGEYDRNSPYLNRMTGVFRTPVQGKYRFSGGMRQMASGKLSLCLCDDREGRRQFLGTTDEEQDGFDKHITWECEEGVGVWVEVIRMEGKAWFVYCGFHVELL